MAHGIGLDGLTERQRRFVDAYIIDPNATKAYITAGYSAKNNAVARTDAARLLAKAHIAAAIAEKGKTLLAKVGVTQERLVDEWARVAFAEVTDKPVTWDAKLKALSEMSARLWPVVQKAELDITHHEAQKELRTYTLEELRALLQALRQETAIDVRGEVVE